MDVTQEILRLFPPGEAEKLANYPIAQAEEIRCRIGQPYVLYDSNGETRVPASCATPAALDYILERASNYSMHSCEAQLRAGFLYTSGGYRIGLCGVVTECGMRSISSLSIRIPHAIRGCAQPIISELLKSGFRNTLIISPPGAGKTTLLRDLIRILSEQGYWISVADERGEIAAVFDRKPQFDLGPRTDVMTGGSKHHSCFMMIRSMNPQILAFDEITAPEDIEAVRYAAGCGVSLLATAHAACAAALNDRPLYRSLLEEHIFERVVEIRTENGRRKYRVVTI